MGEIKEKQRGWGPRQGWSRAPRKVNLGLHESSRQPSNYIKRTYELNNYQKSLANRRIFFTKIVC